LAQGLEKADELKRRGRVIAHDEELVEANPRNVKKSLFLR
jgi:hypothetical protein